MMKDDKIFGDAFQAGSTISQSLAMECSQRGSKADILAALLNLSAGIMNTIALLLVDHEKTESMDDFNPESVLNTDLVSFAHILACKSTVDVTSKITTVELGPHVIWEALQAYERMTGAKPDKFLSAGLVKAGRSIGAEGSEVIQAFMERRRLAENGGSGSLN